VSPFDLKILKTSKFCSFDNVSSPWISAEFALVRAGALRVGFPLEPVWVSFGFVFPFLSLTFPHVLIFVLDVGTL